MNVTSSLECSAKKFFGLDKPEDLMKFGLENLLKLKESMKKKYNIVDLGVVTDRNFSTLLSRVGIRPQQIAEFKEKKLATLTIRSNAFNHGTSSGMDTHTIGLAINKNPNQYLYQENPEILLIDSLGNSYTRAREVHQSLIREFIAPAFPNSRITITQVPQQTDGSLTCLNWALANLKTVRENMGRADILTLLPKSSDLPKILEEQRQFLQRNPCESS